MWGKRWHRSWAGVSSTSIARSSDEQGRKIREIFAGEGEPEFRKIEMASLRVVLASAARPLVLATGGGTYVQVGNAELLRAEGAVVVFLQATPETLLRRCCDGEAGSQTVGPRSRGISAAL